MDNNAPTDPQGPEKAAKKEEDVPKRKRTRRHFRQQAKRAREADSNDPRVDIRAQKQQDDTPTASLTPTEILELFHAQDLEASSLSARVSSARYVVENGASGDFYQVRTKQHRRMTPAGPGTSLSLSLLKMQRLRRGRGRHSVEEQRWSWRKMVYDSEKTLVLLGLGGVAGMCWMEALNVNTTISVTASSSNGSFACTYSAVANRSRQIFFVLFKYPPTRSLSPLYTPIALTFTSRLPYIALRRWNFVLLCTCVSISLVRQLSKATLEQDGYEGVRDRTASERASYRLLQAATGLVVSALVVLVAASPSALRLGHAFRVHDNWCEAVASTAPLFLHGISMLKTCAMVNAVLISMAWLLVALQCSIPDPNMDVSHDHMVELEASVVAHEKRIDQLQGEHLDQLPVEALKALIQLHQRATEQTEGVLAAKLQQQQLSKSANTA